MKLDEIATYAGFPKIDLDHEGWKEALKLPEYSATMPSGVIPGKRWRRHDGAFDRDSKATPVWLLCEYGPEVEGRCAVLISRPRVRIGAKTTRMVPYLLWDLSVSDQNIITKWFEDELGYQPKIRAIGITGNQKDSHFAFQKDVHFIFQTDADAVAFVLRWSDCWSKSNA